MAGVALVIAAPMTAAIALPLCLVAPLAWCWRSQGRLPPLKASPVMACLALAAIYLLINAVWSLDYPSALLTGIWLLAFVAVLHVTKGTLDGLAPRPLRAMALGFYAGVALGSLFLCFEIVSDQWLRRLVENAVPRLRSDPRHLVMEGDRIIKLPTYLLNRSIAAWTLLYWPALLVLWRLDLPRRQWMLLAALGLLPGVAAVFLSDHETSKLAFLGAAVAWAVFLATPALTRRLFVAGWVAATLLMVPMTMIAFSSQLYLAPWLAGSAQDRIVLWGYTSQQVLRAPILGVGVKTSSVLGRPSDADDSPQAPGSTLRMSIRHHTHNGYLQVWYEAGAVGALLLFGFGILTLRSLAKLPIDAQPFLYATFATCALVAASSFSLWQAWFIGLLGLASIFAMLGCSDVSSRRERVDAPPVANR